MRTRILVVLAALITIIAADSAQAQFFTDPLRAAIFGPNLHDTDSAFVVSREGARRRANEPAASSNRHYVTTTSTDYLSTDWTFEITFQTSANAPDDIVFIGFGEAVADETYFNEPRNSVEFRIHQGQTAFGTGWRVDIAAHGTGRWDFPYQAQVGFLPGAEGGTHIARIRKVGNQVSFEILGSGIVGTIDIAETAWFLPNSSRIFFGNASSAYSFNEVRVLQETAGWHL